MKHTLVILQCCSRKNGPEEFPQKDFNLDVRLPKTKTILEVGIQKFFQFVFFNVYSFIFEVFQ